jgi:hypothetical protein
MADIPDSLHAQISEMSGHTLPSPQPDTQIQMKPSPTTPANSNSKSQYTIQALSAACWTCKRQRGIDGAICIIIAPKSYTQPSSQYHFSLPEVYNVFSAYPDLPVVNPDPFLHAFLAVDKKRIP